MEKDSVIEKAPIYVGGKDDKFWFIDNEYNRERDNLDRDIMDSLVAIGIGENPCPRQGEWIHFCIVMSIITALMDASKSFCFTIPKKASLNNIEEHSWHYLWNLLGCFPEIQGTKEKYKKFSSNFTGSLLRIFIPRHNTGFAPVERPCNMSYFVEKWGFSFNIFPDTLHGKTCNVRLCHLQRGREVFETLSREIKESIKLIARYIPIILKNDINPIIEE